MEQGREAFARLCAWCHGLDGRGAGPAAGALDPVPADLTRIAARRHWDFPVAAIVRVIDSRDPVAGEAEARDKVLFLVEYLRSIQAE